MAQWDGRNMFETYYQTPIFPLIAETPEPGFVLLCFVLFYYHLDYRRRTNIFTYSFRSKIDLQLELIIGSKGGNQWFSVFGHSLLIGSLREVRLSLKDRFLLLAFLPRMLNSCRTSVILNSFIRINMIRQLIIYLRT